MLRLLAIWTLPARFLCAILKNSRMKADGGDGHDTKSDKRKKTADFIEPGIYEHCQGRGTQ